MKWYNDGKNTIWFQSGRKVPEDFHDIRKERRILYNIINTCYRRKLDPFLVLNAFCVSEMADLICHNSHIGYFYGEGVFLHELERYNVLRSQSDEWDIIRFHWILDVYLTARDKLNMTYFEIASQYPPEEVYKKFNPLHETSESNALSKMKFDRVDLCGCIINAKYYLYLKDVPENERFLLSKYDEAIVRLGVIHLDTVFFHLVDEANGYLSNWYTSDFVIDGMKFNCVEQYMMWKKADLFRDYETAEMILIATDPAVMKELGRHVRGYSDSKWAAVRYTFVRDAVFAKFSQNEDLRNKLLNTSGLFAECAVNDLVWGIGLSMTDPERVDRIKWRGQNLLGMALEDVYNELK